MYRSDVFVFSSRSPLLDLYSVSHMWYTLIAVLTVMVVGIPISQLTRGKNSKEVDKNLIIYMKDIYLYCRLFICD